MGDKNLCYIFFNTERKHIHLEMAVQKISGKVFIIIFKYLNIEYFNTCDYIF